MPSELIPVLRSLYRADSVTWRWSARLRFWTASPLSWRLVIRSGAGLTTFFRVPRTELIDSTFPVDSDLPIAVGII
jgi:hypothetical protein